MTKKKKTPRTGKPPKGFVRVVMDYPVDEYTTFRWDIDRGHRVVVTGAGETAAPGRLIWLLRRREDAPN